MATYITLLNFTDQGIRNVKDSPSRADAFIQLAQKLGIQVKGMYWTVGHYDLVTILEAPNDEVATAALLTVGALGNVRSQTLRAFSAEEMGKIIGNMP